KADRMKDSSVATTSPAPASPTTNKEEPPINHVFRDTRSELAQLLKKKEEIEVCLRISTKVFIVR
ncbi:unnamed protein product, partial [Rotaria magnacalcarata]